MDRIGLPMPVKELAARRCDAIGGGAGHNGLTCAACLARAGRKVLALEARERIGGAATLEERPGLASQPTSACRWPTWGRVSAVLAG